jgi:hypothetical protein
MISIFLQLAGLDRLASRAFSMVSIMNDYQTPIRKKTYLMGMTLPQLGLLGGMGAVMLVIVVLGLKLVLFAPPVTVVPTVTPVDLSSIAPQLASGQTPTPAPDLSTAVLTIDDLPAGFVPATGNTQEFDFNKLYPAIDIHPVGQFVFYEINQQQYVVGWTFAFATSAERENFDMLVVHPNAMFYSAGKPQATPETLKGSELGNSSPIGELSTGWASLASSDGKEANSDVVLFSHKNFGGIVEVFYDPKQTPVIGAWMAARELDDRIMDVTVNGPVPTPVAVAFDDLVKLNLTLADLPAGFKAMADSEIKYDQKARADLATEGVQIAGEFGFEITKTNYEEFVLGYTYLFSTTVGKALMDSLLSSEDMLNAIYTPSKDQGWEQWKVTTVNKPIGERAYSAALMGMSTSGGIRMDLLTFRRGHVGVMLLHGYHTGRWQITVEALGDIMDKKIETLTGSR